MGAENSELWSADPTDGAGAARAPVVPRWPRGAGGLLRTLKARLTLTTVGLLIVGVASLSMLSLDRVASDLLATAEARELSQSARLAQDLSQRVVALQQSLAAIADGVAPQGPLDDAQAERRLSAQPVMLQQFSNLFVAAPDGRVRVVVDNAGARRPTLSIADRGYFRTLMTEQRPVVSEALPGRISSEPIIVVAHPVVRDGRVDAVVGGAIRLRSRSLAASLIDSQGEADTDELLVIADETGRILAHPVADRLMKDVADEPRLAEAVADWRSMGSPSEPAGLLLDQPGQIVSAAGVASTGWVVWRALPRSSLLAPLRQARWEALRNAALVISALGALTFALVHRLLRPLRQLQARALHLFDARRPIHDGWPEDHGEVGALAHVLRHVGAERAHLESFTNQVMGRLNSIMAAAPLGIGFTRHQRFELINPAWCECLQRDEHELLGQPASTIFASDEDYETLGVRVGEAFAHHGQYSGEWRFRRKDGSVLWGQINGRPVEPGNPDAGTIWTFVDVTAARARREDLEWSATHDALTGLGNRVAFEQRLRAVLGHPPAALVVLDLDRFKPINDGHGHLAGDAMLKRVAHALQAHVRVGDTVARIGGDEFAIILERCPPDAAWRIAAEVQQAIEAASLTWQGQRLSVGASVGVAPLSEAYPTIAAWIAAADEACYAAKGAGRGRVCGVGEAPGAAPVITPPEAAVPRLVARMTDPA